MEIETVNVYILQISVSQGFYKDKSLQKNNSSSWANHMDIKSHLEVLSFSGHNMVNPICLIVLKCG